MILGNERLPYMIYLDCVKLIRMGIKLFNHWLVGKNDVLLSLNHDVNLCYPMHYLQDGS